MFFQRRTACGFEYELSYVAFSLFPFCSAAGGRHGDEILRVGAFASGCESFVLFYRFLCFPPWVRGASVRWTVRYPDGEAVRQGSRELRFSLRVGRCGDAGMHRVIS